jgi:hypothetical protein
MSFNPEYAWGGPQQAPEFDQYQAERDNQAQQLGLPTGLNEADYMAAFQQLMASPEWAATQQGRRDVIAQDTAANWQHYQDLRDKHQKQFATNAAMLIGGGVLGAALGPGLGASGAGGGAGGATAGLSEIGLPAGVGYLPGGTGVAGAGASGVTAAFGGAPMASLPAALSSPASIGAFTGGAAAPAASGPIYDGQGNEIPGMDYSTPPTGMERFNDIIGKLGGTLGQMSSAPPGGAQGYGGGGELAQMMQALLQRQRIPTPQGPMGPRYKPYG